MRGGDGVFETSYEVFTISSKTSKDKSTKFGDFSKKTFCCQTFSCFHDWSFWSISYVVPLHFHWHKIYSIVSYLNRLNLVRYDSGKGPPNEIRLHIDVNPLAISIRHFDQECRKVLLYQILAESNERQRICFNNDIIITQNKVLLMHGYYPLVFIRFLGFSLIRVNIKPLEEMIQNINRLWGRSSPQIPVFEI